MRTALVLTALLAALAVPAGAATVIAHRGASGYLPEHTLAAYAYAYATGADFIEPDLVMTADGVLVARHEPTLDLTTDVAERFPQRRAGDGHWYAADLTAAELATLSVSETREGRFPRGPAPFGVPTLADILALVAGLNAATGCTVGLYPELKWPAWHEARDLDPVAALRATLAASDFDGPLRIQSFEAPPLIALARHPIPGAELVQLVEDAQGLTPEALDRVAAYADGVGPWLGHLDEARTAGTDAVAAARERGLVVDTWTLRADQLGPFEDFDALMQHALVTLGVDGVFTDHPDRAVAWLRDHQEEPAPCAVR
jgi:glycerophosphoryl diester phosphodiesterase